MNLWLVVTIIGGITLATRVSFILLFGIIEVPALLGRALRFVPAAVLSAIILPDLLLTNERLNLSLGNERLLAGSLAMLVAWRSKNVLLTIATGMTALWLAQLIE